jgi:hypothetical protein
MKNSRIPYHRYKNIIFIKNIDYNIGSNYKKVSYLYETYNEKGELIKESLHRKNSPAVIIYYHNYISEVQYWKHGKKHREYGPAIIQLDKKHNIINEQWFINNKEIKDKELEDIKLLIDRRKKIFKVILRKKSI